MRPRLATEDERRHRPLLLHPATAARDGEKGARLATLETRARSRRRARGAPAALSRDEPAELDYLADVSARARSPR